MDAKVERSAAPVEIAAPLAAAQGRSQIQAFADEPAASPRLQVRTSAAITVSSYSDAVLVTLFAEFIANDKPFLVEYDGSLYMPIFKMYTEKQFGGEFETEADYRDPAVQQFIHEKGGWMVWPLIPYSYRTIKLDLPVPAPAPPSW